MNTLNSAALDAQYNNRVLVPEFAAHLSRWASESARVRDRQPCVLNLPYGQGDNETVDVFHAQMPAKREGVNGGPVVVFIHGGYWRSLDKSDHSFVAPTFAQAGACVFVPNYSLCPGEAGAPVTVPDIALQMSRAMAWVYANAPAHGGDPQRITVVGHSAGGHLAAMLMACDWSKVLPTQPSVRPLPRALVKNALSISGLYDLEPIRQTPFLQTSLRLTERQAHMSSPVHFPRPARLKGRGALHCVVGQDESPEFLRHNQLMRQAWGVRSVPTAAQIPMCNHFSVLEELALPKTDLNALALSLIAP